MATVSDEKATRPPRTLPPAALGLLWIAACILPCQTALAQDAFLNGLSKEVALLRMSLSVGAPHKLKGKKGVAPAVRSITGRGNNQQNPDWGIPGTRLLRGPSGCHYADGISSMHSPAHPSPRAVSNALFAQDASIPSAAGLSDFIWAWGQFIDHDLDLTEGLMEPEPIAVPVGDPFFDPQAKGTVTILFRRGLYDPTTGVDSPREQINQVTSYLDGSMVYGSDAERASWLRTYAGGRLNVTATESGDLLPYNDGTVPNGGAAESLDVSTSLFVAGDIRANEQPVLAALHTLFVREHNRLAAALQKAAPALTDEELYQIARSIVVGELQHITYEEFLPALLGKDALAPYAGYDSEVNAGIRADFSGAAFRLGHTLLSPSLLRLAEDGSSLEGGPVALRDAFFDATPPLLEHDGIEPYFRGLAVQRAQELDHKVIDDVRNFLFGPPGAGGFDLVALNLQRGRDLGLPSYNALRSDYGLPKRATFHSITKDPAAALALREQYRRVTT